MALPWWQHHKYCLGYYYIIYYKSVQFDGHEVKGQTRTRAYEAEIGQKSLSQIQLKNSPMNFNHSWQARITVNATVPLQPRCKGQRSRSLESDVRSWDLAKASFSTHLRPFDRNLYLYLVAYVSDVICMLSTFLSTFLTIFFCFFSP